MSNYEVKGVPIKISATSRVAIRIKENYYTVEASEERNIPKGAEMKDEWKALFDEINSVTDSQCEEIISTFK